MEMLVGEEVLPSRDLTDRRGDSMDTSMLDYYDGRMDVGKDQKEITDLKAQRVPTNAKEPTGSIITLRLLMVHRA